MRSAPSWATPDVGGPLHLPTIFHSPAERDFRVATAVNQLIQALARSGTTAERPQNPNRGVMYFDTDLGSPIWWNGTVWVWPSSEEAPS